MAIVTRDVRDSDLPSVLALNNSAGPGILPIDQQRLRKLFDVARYFRVSEINGQLAGFLIGLTREAAYDSPNFHWFREHYDEFVYIDRVVVADSCRRHGIGRVLYADVLSFAELRTPWLTCEVFVDPRDDVALVFFGTQGFEEAGILRLDNGRTVSLMAKPLKNHEFVRDTYLASQARSGAPQEWWADRLHAAQPLRQIA
jgi:predicted GNAT superfamily acetyltransferase